MTVAYYIIKLFLWIVVAYGITQIVVESTLFNKLRMKVSMRSKFFGDMLNCMLCTSVWVTFIMSVYMWSPTKAVFLYDVVNVERMEIMHTHMIYSQSDTIESAIISLNFQFRLWLYKIAFIFFDGMLGSTFVWFMHIFERRLSSFSKSE